MNQKFVAALSFSAPDAWIAKDIAAYLKENGILTYCSADTPDSAGGFLRKNLHDIYLESTINIVIWSKSYSEKSADSIVNMERNIIYNRHILKGEFNSLYILSVDGFPIQPDLEMCLFHDVRQVGIRGTIDHVLNRLAKAAENRRANFERISWEQTTNTAALMHREIDVQFSPDIVVTMSGPGSWAAMYCMSIRSNNTPVLTAVTFPIREMKSDIHVNFIKSTDENQWLNIITSKWIVYIPNIFSKLPKSTKILILDDRVISGETQGKLKTTLIDFGFEDVRCAALFASDLDEEKYSKTIGNLDFCGLKFRGDFMMPWGRKNGRI